MFQIQRVRGYLNFRIECNRCGSVETGRGPIAPVAWARFPLGVDGEACPLCLAELRALIARELGTDTQKQEADRG